MASTSFAGDYTMHIYIWSNRKNVSAPKTIAEIEHKIEEIATRVLPGEGR
jgi:hypothetical protein